MTDLEALSREELIAELSRLRQERTALVAKFPERVVHLRTLAHRLAQPHSDYLASEAARTLREIANELETLRLPRLPDPPEGGT